MSDLSFNQYSRLSDSLERDLMRKALTDGESISIVTAGKKALASVKKFVIAMSNYMIAVTQAMDEARAKDARFSRAQW
ncbi:hypothetical protein [Pollutimonas sp. M17]|uniref:hypothetical protein n=1 Tax=Pollutimonas sp. M17 TaxID=2962065 RepID=UPI0021F47A7C|nr:hypothetical protein [Pollutimonas sp. M17]UYO94198.1 hypothetical protein OEG81_02370 [Pollutimonas sp. M17]HWK71276.1 hypothetical protein [Burkholderiaceae bacterium]